MKSSNAIIAAASLSLLVGVGAYRAGRQAGDAIVKQELVEARLALEAAHADRLIGARLDGNAATEAGDDQKAAMMASAKRSLSEVLGSARRRLTESMVNVSGIVAAAESMRAIDLEDMPEVLRLIGEMPNFQQKNLLYMVALTRWADEDGLGAAGYVSENLDGERKAGMLGAVFSSWAANDPDAAWNWFQNHRTEFANPGHEHPLVRSLFQGLATNDFPAAMKKLEGLEAFDLQVMALEAIGAVVATDTARRETFLKHVSSLENQQQRLRAVRSVLGPLAQADPETAKQWVDAQAPGTERAEAAKSVANAWFETAPDQASEWFLSQVPDDALPAAMRDITQRWLRRDPNLAGEWLSKFETGHQTDPARATFSQGIAGMDPVSAVTWAQTITNDKMREGSLVNIYKQWRMRDPGAAENALKASGLGAEQVQQVLEP